MSDLQSAKEAYERAERELRRHAVAEMLTSRPGISYARVGGDTSGPYLVAYRGQIIGEIVTRSPGIVRDWWSLPIKGIEHGPYPTARAAAAALAAKHPVQPPP